MLRAWKLRTPSQAEVRFGALARSSTLKVPGSDFNSQWFMVYLKYGWERVS